MRKLLLPMLLLTSVATANELEDWFTTAAGNNTGSTPNYPVEGMAPSAVNDTMREMMAVLARNWADMNGSNTTAGAANTYTLAADATVSALAEGQTYLIEINATNTGASTLNVDSTGARDIVRDDGSALVGGELQTGGRYLVSYDAGRNDYTLVGAFSTYSLDKLDLSGTDPVDLVDTGNALNVGNLAGSHLAFDGNTIQVKSTATGTNALNINEFGGLVRIGAQSGTGSVNLYNDGTLTANTTASGIDIQGTQLKVDAGSDSNNFFRMLNTPGGVETVLVATSAEGRIRQTDNAGTFEDNWITMARNGAVTLYNNNAARIATTSSGGDVSGTDFDIDSAADSTTRVKVLNTNGGIGLQTQITTGEGRLRQLNSSGTGEDVWVNMTRNGAVTTYHNNTAMTRTATAGNGGFEVNNTVTGAGFERVLTTGDLEASATTTAEGIVELATTAETVAGTDTDRAITAAGFAGTKSLAEDGFYVLPGNLVIQWGSDSVLSNTTDTLTYPRAITTFYAGGCSYEGLTDTTIGDACAFDHFSTTQFRLTNGDDDGTRTITWWAYGLD